MSKATVAPKGKFIVETHIEDLDMESPDGDTYSKSNPIRNKEDAIKKADKIYESASKRSKVYDDKGEIVHKT